MWPDAGLQTDRPAGQWRGDEEPGQARQCLGPLPGGSSQPCSQGPQPGLGAAFLFLRPALPSSPASASLLDGCGPRGGLSGSALPCLPSLWTPQDTFGQLKTTLLKGSGLGPRGWSNCHEQRATLDPRRSCQSMICSGRRGGTEAPKRLSSLHSGTARNDPNYLYTQIWIKIGFHF